MWSPPLLRSGVGGEGMGEQVLPAPAAGYLCRGPPAGRSPAKEQEHAVWLWHVRVGAAAGGIGETDRRAIASRRAHTGSPLTSRPALPAAVLCRTRGREARTAMGEPGFTHRPQSPWRPHWLLPRRRPSPTIAIVRFIRYCQPSQRWARDRICGFNTRLLLPTLRVCATKLGTPTRFTGDGTYDLHLLSTPRTIPRWRLYLSPAAAATSATPASSSSPSWSCRFPHTVLPSLFPLHSPCPIADEWTQRQREYPFCRAAPSPCLDTIRAACLVNGPGDTMYGSPLDRRAPPRQGAGAREADPPPWRHENGEGYGAGYTPRYGGTRSAARQRPRRRCQGSNL